MSSGPFSRTRGRLELRLQPHETDILRPLFAQMLELLEQESQPDDMERLFPPGYEHDHDAQAEFESLTRNDLLEGKRRSLRIADKTFDKMRVKRGSLIAVLDADEQQAWLASLNDLRLYLGTRLGVTEDSYEDISNEPIDPAMQVYLYLGWLEESLLETLL